MTAPVSLLRDRTAAGHARVGFVELFFDLVFVFAITQLSHRLLEHLTVKGALETAFLLLAVWTVWMWTTWVANWLDARRAAVRLMLFVTMAAGLVVSASIPEAFGARGLAFGCAFAFMQNFKNAFLVWALRKGDENIRRNFERVQVWLLISAVFWVAGGFADGPLRWALWAAALFAEMGSPWWNLYVPGMGRSTTRDWAIDAGHMAERCGLFIILSLGESIIILGATFAGLHWDGVHLATFGLGLAGAAAMWWIYFVGAAERAEEAFARHADSGRIARAAYTYAHIPIVAGIIVVAVADEIVLAHPTGHVEPAAAAAIFGGPALFLLGNAVFIRLACGRFPVSHWIAIAAIAGALFMQAYASPVALGGLVVAVLIAVAARESLTSRRAE